MLHLAPTGSGQGVFSKLQPDQDGGDGDYRQAGDSQLLVAGGHAAVQLRAVDAALDLIAIPVARAIEVALGGLVGLGGNDRPNPAP